MKTLQNKLVFITGASSGIGKACAELFAKNGARLLLCARRMEKLQSLVAELKQKYQTTIQLMELDVRNREEVQHQFSALASNWQEIDILINNAGLAAGMEKAQEASLDDWDQMIDTNVKGLLYVTRAVLPDMVHRNRGHIINLGSVAGHEVYPGGSVYCATKHAVLALSKGLKLDLLGTQIRVSSIDPGMVKTEFSEVRFKGDHQKAEAVYKGLTPLSPEDIADAIYYCASRPPHVNISEMILLATAQGSATHVSRHE